MSEDRDPDLQPLDVDGVGAVAVGTVVWAVAFVVCLLLQGRLDAAGDGWERIAAAASPDDTALIALARALAD